MNIGSILLTLAIGAVLFLSFGYDSEDKTVKVNAQPAQAALSKKALLNEECTYYKYVVGNDVVRYIKCKPIAGKSSYIPVSYP